MRRSTPRRERHGRDHVRLLSELRVDLDLARWTRVEFEDCVLLSLDCSTCGREGRTVWFTMGDAMGRCSEECDVRGRLLLKDNPEPSSVRYVVEHFDDATTFVPPRSPWGRVSFAVRCLLCRGVTKNSVQPNDVLPWTLRCRCTRTLYTLTDTLPKISTRPG